MVAANREESCRRPATLPRVYQSGRTRCLLAGENRGPDGRSGRVGTWLGVNQHGLVVAVTNRDYGDLHSPDRTQSRGLLCTELLGREDALTAAEHAERELARGGYGGSNLLLAGQDGAWVIHAPSASRVRR